MVSRSFIVSALMGFAAATKHEKSIPASESLLMSATAAAAVSASTGVSAAAGMGMTPSGMVATHVVQVGGSNGSLEFFPNNVAAMPGDLVQFQFHPKNHSVVRSTFDNPCIPMANIQANATDTFFSGFMPTNASVGSTKNILTYTIRVKDTKPVWFYCSQAKHCQAGMVGAINAPSSGNKTLAAFIALAAKAPETLSPGQSSGSAAGNTPPSPSSGSGANSGSGTGSGSGSSGSGSGTGSSSTSAGAPQQTTNDAGKSVAARSSLLGLVAAGVVAFAML